LFAGCLGLNAKSRKSQKQKDSEYVFFHRVILLNLIFIKLTFMRQINQ
jgi:hypothetical protein